MSINLEFSYFSELKYPFIKFQPDLQMFFFWSIPPFYYKDRLFANRDLINGILLKRKIY